MKRAADAQLDRGGRPKMGRLTKYGQYAFKVLCPEPMVAKMMGDKGSVVHQVEDQTSCHLQFSPRGDFYPDTRFRVLVIVAQEVNFILEALTVVVDQIVARAGEEQSPGRPTGKGRTAEFIDEQGRIIFRCALSKAAAGAIIGTKGERIRYLRDSTSALIDIDRDVVDNHQLGTVAGSREQLLAVIEELNNTVQADAQEGWFQEWAGQRSISAEGRGAAQRRGPPPGGQRERPFERSGSASELGAAGRRSHATDEHRGCTIFVGRLSQATTTESLRAHFEQYGEVLDSDVRTDTTTGRSKGFGFITFAEPACVETCLEAKADQMVDGRWVDVQRYGENDGGEEEDAHREQAPPPRTAERDERRTSGAWPQRSGSGGAAPVARDGEWFGRLAGTMNPEYLEYDYCITCSMPSAKCGALIGRKGEHVLEVQKETGTLIDISRKDPNEGPDAHRTITITGPLLSVYGAHLLLMRHYNEEEAHFQAARADAGVGDPQQIESMKRQLAALQEELEKVQGGVRRGGPGPSQRPPGGLARGPRGR